MSTNEEFYYGYSDSPNEDHNNIATTPSGASFFVCDLNLPQTYIFEGGRHLPDCPLLFRMEQENYHTERRILERIVTSAPKRYCYIKTVVSEDGITEASETG